MGICLASSSLSFSLNFFIFFIKGFMINNHVYTVVFNTNKYSYNTKDKINDIDFNYDRFMSLSYQLKSDESKRFIENIALYVTQKGSSFRKSTAIQKAAFAAIAADLLSVQNHPETIFLYRTRVVSDFTKQRIGYKPAIAALDGLVEQDFLYHQPGVWRGSRAKGEGTATRYRPKPAFLEMALQFGITPGNWKEHFERAPRPSAIAHPIVVRAKRQYWDRDEKGKRLTICPENQNYILAKEQVDRINLFMAPQNLEGMNHNCFVRIFNHGDASGFDYNMGGQLYSQGDGNSYQNMPKALRFEMRINGERIVELDLRASFLTLLYALYGIELKADTDPYVIGNWLPREVVKAWISMTFGYDRFHQHWSDDIVLRFYDAYGWNIITKYPIETIRAEVIKHHAILADWEDSTSWRWYNLQYMESCVIVDTVEMLGLQHNIAALPLHDALLVGESNVETARIVLEEAFEKRFDVKPVLTVKSEWEKTKRVSRSKTEEKALLKRLREEGKQQARSANAGAAKSL